MPLFRDVAVSTSVVVDRAARYRQDDDHPAAMATKIAKLRIFHDDKGRMNRSLLDVGGLLFVISRLTPALDLRGNRPGFSTAASLECERARDKVSSELAVLGLASEIGRFGAYMRVSRAGDHMARPLISPQGRQLAF